jgi:transcriptional regulator GlxA family with amidase domain
MTIGQYQGRLRLRRGIIDLRACDSKVDDVARMLGYRSPKNFCGVLKDQTGLTPSEARNLTESAVRRLLDVTLALPQHVAAAAQKAAT